MVNIPDGYEALQPRDVDKIKIKMEEKGARLPNCELCGHGKWQISPVIVSPVVLHRNKEKNTLKSSTEQSLNQVSFSCENCGNTKYVELHFLGVRLSDEAVKSDG